MANSISSKLDWALMNPILASALNPVLSNPLLKGIMLTDVVLAIGDNVINTGLGKNQTGWFVVDQNAASSIHRSAPFNGLTLTLNSSAVVTASIWVF
jgi:hypothetical protein